MSQAAARRKPEPRSAPRPEPTAAPELVSESGVWRVRVSPMLPVIDLLGDSYALRILRHIATGERRFDALVEAIDLPRSTLSSRLKHLTAHHILTASYQLTARGRDAIGAVLMLDQWNATHQVGGPVHLRPEHRCGAPLELVLGCASCAEPVRGPAVKVLDLPGVVHRPNALPPYRRRRHDEVEGLSAHDCFGDRWVALLLGALFLGLRRFSEIAEALEIAANVLSTRLAILQKNHIIELHQPDDAGRGHYALTPKGRELFPLALAFQAWGERWLTPGWEARAGYGLLHRPCSSWLRSTLTCASCHRPFSLDDVSWNAVTESSTRRRRRAG